MLSRGRGAGRGIYTLPRKGTVTLNSRSKLLMSSVKQQTFIGYKQLEIRDVDGVKRKIYYVDLGTDKSNVPLVILVGTAQTVNSFSPHHRQIAKTRRLIIIELRCQGMTELLSEYGSIEQHVKDFILIMNVLGLNSIHLAGDHYVYKSKYTTYEDMYHYF
jgi:hypothetical protein